MRCPLFRSGFALKSTHWNILIKVSLIQGDLVSNSWIREVPPYTHTHTYAVLAQGFQDCFNLNSTANNNSMLSQGYPHQHLLMLNGNVSGSSMSSFSPPIMQHQTNPAHISSRDHTMSQSNSDSMSVSSSHSMQQANHFTFHVQGETHTG